MALTAQETSQDETFWEKFGTLGKNKKKAQEVKIVETEGKYAIDSPGMPKSAEMPPELKTLKHDSIKNLTTHIRPFKINHSLLN